MLDPDLLRWLDALSARFLEAVRTDPEYSIQFAAQGAKRPPERADAA